MLFLFPRLDRPSVIGDDGRPRTASLTAASLIVVALMVVAGFVTGQSGTLQTAGLVSGLAAAGLVLLDRDRFGQQFVGVFISIPVGSGMVLWLLYSTAVSVGILAGISMAMFGLALTWVDMGDRESAGAIVENLSVSYGGIILGLVVPLGALVCWLLVQGLLGVDVSSVLAVGIFLLVLSVTATSLYLGCRWLPIVQLVARPRRAEIEQQLGRIRKYLLILAAGSFAAIIPAVLGLVFVFSGAGPLFRLVGSPFVIVPMLVVSFAVLLVSTIVLLVERVLQGTNEDVQRLIAAMCVGAVIGTFVFISPTGGAFITVALALVLLGPILFIVGGVAVVVAMGLGLLPEEGGGLAIASAGLVVATLGAGLSGAPAPFVFACAAATLVVWDLSTFGLGLTAELGHLPETRRLEIVHAVGVVGLAAVTVLVVSGLYTLQQSAGFEATGAMVLVAMGGLFVVFTLRG